MSEIKFSMFPWRAGEAEFSRAVWDSLRHPRKPMTVVQSGSDVVAVVWDDGDGSDEKTIARLIAEAPAMFAAIQEFCAKVDRGEARSKRSYAAFAEIIERVTGAA